MTANDYIAALIAADTGLTELMASIHEKQAATHQSAEPRRSGR
ncbi:hypothetical protein E143388_07518 [Rhodococcus opacus]|nr:hypothetical protein E143388_07518 [Rhodococcus opacus]